MSQTNTYLCLDVGEVRTGVAVADSKVRIPIPYETFSMDKSSLRTEVARLVAVHDADTIVIGYPRNQSGEPTAQTRFVEGQAETLQDMDVHIVFQDESLSSVEAERRLKSRHRPYGKADIDAEAACIILESYLEGHK